MQLTVFNKYHILITQKAHQLKIIIQKPYKNIIFYQFYLYKFCLIQKYFLNLQNRLIILLQQNFNNLIKISERVIL